MCEMGVMCDSYKCIPENPIWVALAIVRTMIWTADVPDWLGTATQPGYWGIR